MKLFGRKIEKKTMENPCTKCIRTIGGRTCKKNYCESAVVWQVQDSVKKMMANA